ncbi:MAG TPA: ribosome-associated translation inhibitor RaiA [Gemmatimonadota bacterium]|nr:ribosome-associated translation inhibitor RaiA [Gemmatimonadota bacterium]
MQITFSSRHGELPDALKEYARQEVEGLSRYFERLVEADITLDQEGHRNIAEVRIHSSNDTHFASSETEDMRSAIDGTLAKLKRQLQRHKDKLNRRQLTKGEREFVAGRMQPVAESPPDMTAAPVEWDRITSGEAIERLSASGEEVLVFVDTADGAVKIARLDGEGSISVVEAEAFEMEDR